MSASKDRLRWAQLPARVRQRVEMLAGGRVLAAEDCAGGYSPGLAARLRLPAGERVFVKAIDCREWPSQASMYRAEARVSATLPAHVPAPRLRVSDDDGDWVILVFDCADGAEPARPWRPADLGRVVNAAGMLARAEIPSSVQLQCDHPRLGGWADIAADDVCRARLAARSAWAADRLPMLVEMEAAGKAAAHGCALVHFDMYAHNILLTAGQVLFVDWPWARRGAPMVDTVMLLASAAADGIDPEPFLAASQAAAGVGSHALTALLAAHAGFCMSGALQTPEPGLEPIYAAKLELGTAALGWLERRLAATA